jgi:hypothetical protein
MTGESCPSRTTKARTKSPTSHVPNLTPLWVADRPPFPAPWGRMNVTFTIRDDGQVDAYLDDAWPIFNEALADSISSLPPRGATGRGPSTYWIDIAESGARRAASMQDETPFARGNITMLRVQHGQVVASFDFAGDDEPGEAMPLAEFLGLLAAWRSQVLVTAAHSADPLPETYRRNPCTR